MADIARAAAVGGTVPYAYFANKEDLFLAALDEDAPAVIHTGMSIVVRPPEPTDWRTDLMLTLVEPSRPTRWPGGCWPASSPTSPTGWPRSPRWPSCGRRWPSACGDEQRERHRPARHRPASPSAAAWSSIILSLLMSMVQLGKDVTATYAADVVAVFSAAIDPVPTPPPPPG